MKDGGASTLCDNTATDEGSTYSIVLTATEMSAARLVLKIVDAAAKVLLDKVIIIETYGNASGQHAFDLDTADQVAASVTAGVTLAAGAITNASLAGNMEIVFETDFSTNYNTTRDAWVNNYTDIIGTMDAAAFGANFLTNAKIADNAFDSEQFAADFLTNAKIADAAFAAEQFAADFLTEAKIADDAFANEHFDATAGVFHHFGILDQGQAQAVTGTTIRLRAAAGFANTEIVGARVYIVSATAGAGQTRVITAYSAATDEATVGTWTTTPTGTIVYKVFSADHSVGADRSVLISTDAQDLSGTLDVNTKTMTAGVVDATAIATDAIDADALKADAVTEIGNGVWDTDATGRQTAGSFGQAIGDPGANAETMYEAVVTDAAGTNIAADLIVVDGNVDDIETLVNALPTLSEMLTTQMTESYAADGVAPTLAQAIFIIQQTIGEFTISGTTISAKKIDGTTQAAAYTMDDGTNPTERIRSA
jgi:hypothetical protein